MEQRGEQTRVAACAGCRRRPRVRAVARCGGTAAHWERTSGIPDCNRRPEHDGAWPDVSRCDRTQHRLGPAQEYWYDVRVEGDRVVFHGRGSGHGVGLCQVGAEVMGEEGRSYRQILTFYYPGTRLGVSAQGIPWQQLSSQDVVLFTTRPEHDRPLLPLAARMMHEAEEKTDLEFNSSAKLRVYATVAAFRDATGDPGWVAASTRGHTIRLQPADILQKAGT